MPRYFSVTVMGNSHVFKSELTDEQAITMLSNRHDKSEFAASLLLRVRQGLKLSASQLAWVHKLALEPLPAPSGGGGGRTHREPSPPPPLPPLDTDMTKVLEMFDNAAKRLKNPKVTFHRFKLERDNDGTVAAKTDTAYCGTVALDARFYPTRDSTDEILDDIRRLAVDPVGFACEYGKATGRCCFCTLPLKEERSLGVGYGPICARNYRMPWGKKKATTPEIVGA